jgi:hypothetical protein
MSCGLCWRPAQHPAKPWPLYLYSSCGKGCKTPFWHAPWIQAQAPKDIAPKIFKSSKRKNWKVSQALLNDGWISKIDWGMVLDWDLISQFVELSQLTKNVHLQHDLEHTIVWKLTKDGQYTAASTSFNSSVSSIRK